MRQSEILTENLELHLQTSEQVLASIDVMSAADRAEVSPDWVARVKASTAADPWTHGFAVVQRANATIVGMCAYKGPPGPDGTVEIAYGINPEYQGRGYATEVARALVSFAFDSGQVRLVCAHTRPEENASTHVLTKCGFEWIGEVMDPEDGLVWRWELLPSDETSPPRRAHRTGPEMPVIAKGDRVATIINVFTVAPGNQARLIELLTSATESSVRHVPGFLSAALHRSLDGTKVTMYAQWRTVEDYQRMRGRPDTSPFLAEAMTIATFDPGLYEVVEVFFPEQTEAR